MSRHPRNITGLAKVLAHLNRFGRVDFRQPSVFLEQDDLIRLGYFVQIWKAFPDQAALAEALGVDEEQVTRWAAGEALQPDVERLLRDLAVVVSELEEVYEPEAIPAWLASRAPGETRTPLDLLREGNLAEVLHLINASAHAAYS